MTDSENEGVGVKETTEAIIRGIEIASVNTALASDNLDKQRRKGSLDSDPGKGKGSDPVMAPGPPQSLMDATAQNERNELINENR